MWAGRSRLTVVEVEQRKREKRALVPARRRQLSSSSSGQLPLNPQSGLKRSHPKLSLSSFLKQQEPSLKRGCPSGVAGDKERSLIPRLGLVFHWCFQFEITSGREKSQSLRVSCLSRGMFESMALKYIQKMSLHYIPLWHWIRIQWIRQILERSQGI